MFARERAAAEARERVDAELDAIDEDPGEAVADGLGERRP